MVWCSWAFSLRLQSMFLDAVKKEREDCDCGFPLPRGATVGAEGGVNRGPS